MALQWMEGFDWLASSNATAAADFLTNWSVSASGNGGRVAGVYSGYALYLSATNTGWFQSVWRSFTSQATQILGFAFQASAYPTATSGGSISVGFANASGAAIGFVQFDVSGILLSLGGSPPNYSGVAAVVASSQLATSPPSTGTWNYFELAYTPGTTGTLVLRQNGVEIGSVTGDTTALTGLGSVFLTVRDDGGGAVAAFDNLYVADGTGTQNNTFLVPAHGDVRVDSFWPTGAGSSAQLAPYPSTDANWQTVDEQAQDGDTTYVYSSTAGQTDLYAVTPTVPATDSVLAVGISYVARKDDTGARAVASQVQSGGVVGAGQTYNTTASYVRVNDVFENDPNTAAAWTVAAVNAIEIGMTVIS